MLVTLKNIGGETVVHPHVVSATISATGFKKVKTERDSDTAFNLYLNADRGRNVKEMNSNAEARGSWETTGTLSA